MQEPCAANNYQVEHVQLLRGNLKQWRGCGLMEGLDAISAACQLYFAPFALLSHGTEDDPIMNYANRCAQQLFEMDWYELTQLPSRLSAEAVLQQERERLLKRVGIDGYIDDYSGVRISKSGQRFMIDQATVWNLLDKHGNYYGQAAMFSSWQHLDTNSGDR